MTPDSSDRPADILTASGIATRDTGSQALPRRSQADSQATAGPAGPWSESTGTGPERVSVHRSST
jgi:hypothetical protein